MATMRSQITRDMLQDLYNKHYQKEYVKQTAAATPDPVDERPRSAVSDENNADAEAAPKCADPRAVYDRQSRWAARRDLKLELARQEQAATNRQIEDSKHQQKRRNLSPWDAAKSKSFYLREQELKARRYAKRDAEKKAQADAAQAQCTFRPRISAFVSQRVNGARRAETPFAERAAVWQRALRDELAAKALARDRARVAECTFAPDITHEPGDDPRVASTAAAIAFARARRAKAQAAAGGDDDVNAFEETETGGGEAVTPAKESVAQLVNILRAMPTPGPPLFEQAGDAGFGGGGGDGGVDPGTLAEILAASRAQLDSLQQDNEDLESELFACQREFEAHQVRLAQDFDNDDSD